jgi:hypothetical protein
VAWTSTELLASIKRRAGMPSAQATFQTADLLAIANEQMLEYVVPLVLGVREDYWTKDGDQTLVSGTTAYRIPSRALMAKLREVTILDAQGERHNLPRIALNALHETAFGFWLQGDQVQIRLTAGRNVTDLGETLRLTFTLRPNQIIETSAATTVASFNATAKTITLTSPPSAYTGNTSWDIIRARTPFDSLAYDAAGTLSGSTITFSDTLPADLAAGDFVTLTEQTPVPQIPVELHGLLAQKCAVKILESKQFLDKLAAAAKELGRLEHDARSVLTPRVDGESLRVFNRGSLYRVRF